jgi:hypothetical protein
MISLHSAPARSGLRFQQSLRSSFRVNAEAPGTRSVVAPAPLAVMGDRARQRLIAVSRSSSAHSWTHARRSARFANPADLI